VLEVFSDEVTRDDIFRVLPAVIIHVHVTQIYNVTVITMCQVIYNVTVITMCQVIYNVTVITMCQVIYNVTVITMCQVFQYSNYLNSKARLNIAEILLKLKLSTYK
jgi:TctA family transporter